MEKLSLKIAMVKLTGSHPVIAWFVTEMPCSDGATLVIIRQPW
jgi:hypothetical protein